MMNQILRFARDERASLTVEAILVLPLLLWGYFGMFVLFDGYRALSNNIRASYTISDLLSRELEPVNEDYINGLNDIQDVLTQSPHRTVLRVTVVAYEQSLGGHQLVWSNATEGKEDITEATLQDKIVGFLPVMSNGETLIVVETWMAFVPFLDITLKTLYDNSSSPGDTVFGPFYFESIAVTRPRFAGQLCFEGISTLGCGA
ncbi:ABC-type dipeptide transport system, periplasmic component [Candidatus Rhodobacter oscarellae]|uniref:ABC-type dipeptide transport system, periplasmic component n=1 Tax=Candidatus Rhodobacter oscarellae TaxID=1675527 RepID=A0A0J9E5H3_9RHOB|nr:hypothetical protein [Candidatus Rhodobacter lobularis]KMW57997.1 ABC-type dipeptide transport system, periplasmic component [Candidatus Rhodobacter lobularis]